MRGSRFGPASRPEHRNSGSNSSLARMARNPGSYLKVAGSYFKIPTPWVLIFKIPRFPGLTAPNRHKVGATESAENLLQLSRESCD
eukprot:1647090-Alexandrium_andersonii.AAC.1